MTNKGHTCLRLLFLRSFIR